MRLNILSKKVKINHKKIFNKYGIIILFLVLDILFLCLHYLTGGRIYLFNLDFEKNIPTIYQGIKLILVACLIFSQAMFSFIEKNRKNFYILMPLVLIFGFLALDEAGELHENLYSIVFHLLPNTTSNYLQLFSDIGYNSTYWLLLYLPGIIIVLGYFAYMLHHMFKKQKKLFYIFLAGSVLFASVLVLEVIGTDTNNFFQSSYNIIMPMEEYFEMLGATFFMIFGILGISKYIEVNTKK